MQRVSTLLAAVAALYALNVNTSPVSPHHALGRRAVPVIPGYDFTGCYTEATNTRALTGTGYFDDRMTIEKCAAACTNFKYFGVEYGRECYCGNILNEGSVQTELAECSFACPGDSTQNCGAGNRLNMYIRTTDPTPSTPTEYSYRGCYAEPSNSRALTGERLATSDMTVAKCAAFCGGAGYNLFGLEYYTEVSALPSLLEDNQLTGTIVLLWLQFVTSNPICSRCRLQISL